MTWNSEMSEEIVKSVRSKFKLIRNQSNRSKAQSVRESRPDKFILRIQGQIKEVYENGLPYMTPEEWDSSFYVLGGGPSRRRSWSILNRMNWDTFLSYYNEINGIK